MRQHSTQSPSFLIAELGPELSADDVMALAAARWIGRYWTEGPGRTFHRTDLRSVAPILGERRCRTAVRHLLEAEYLELVGRRALRVRRDAVPQPPSRVRVLGTFFDASAAERGLLPLDALIAAVLRERFPLRPVGLPRLAAALNTAESTIRDGVLRLKKCGRLRVIGRRPRRIPGGITRLPIYAVNLEPDAPVAGRRDVPVAEELDVPVVGTVGSDQVQPFDRPVERDVPGAGDRDVSVVGEATASTNATFPRTELDDPAAGELDVPGGVYQRTLIKGDRAESLSALELYPDGEPLSVPVSEVDTAIALLAERGIRHEKSFVAGSRCREFLEAGGTLAELRRIADAAKLLGRAEGLVWDWKADPSDWREILVDAERRRGESRKLPAESLALASDRAKPTPLEPGENHAPSDEPPAPEQASEHSNHERRHRDHRPSLKRASRRAEPRLAPTASGGGSA